ncbi:MAG: bifunctional (p)ppGpp synthetase/guanosine-3',5'-bis(diphosphate) 3'-pyrophosphohydrolase [Magnetococcales bacterium]|nr:bifunctional (p)ppGpp synthetase/guanosine-3',5'-bis(diphosphate) 3'-pyrophosphohydrolase [Magnetococcales bacterium]MBF0157252.1 bifunctional (p)ppGpp synthetase/guanosine-3',5'-bis(diphosphate) 3'-pyrophosphohydrolase [Magnetococcales bacterium]
MLEEAIRLAVLAHRGQKDKAGQPYILHPLRVMLGLDSDEAKIVGVLHDVVEETSVSFAELRKVGFGDTVLDALDSLTLREGEAYEAYIERVLENPLATQVKRVDLVDNMDIRRLSSQPTGRDWARLGKYRLAYERLLHHRPK